MSVLETIYLALKILLFFIWTAVFVWALSDRVCGSRDPYFAEPAYLPPENATPVAWWKRLLSVPLYLVYFVAAAVFAILFLPAILLDLAWRSFGLIRAKVHLGESPR